MTASTILRERERDREREREREPREVREVLFLISTDSLSLLSKITQPNPLSTVLVYCSEQFKTGKIVHILVVSPSEAFSFSSSSFCALYSGPILCSVSLPLLLSRALLSPPKTHTQRERRRSSGCTLPACS